MSGWRCGQYTAAGVVCVGMAVCVGVGGVWGQGRGHAAWSDAEPEQGWAQAAASGGPQAFCAHRVLLTALSQVLAYMFELGCVVHSFLIGLTLGVQEEDRKEVGN